MSIDSQIPEHKLISITDRQVMLRHGYDGTERKDASYPYLIHSDMVRKFNVAMKSLAQGQVHLQF